MFQHPWLCLCFQHWQSTKHPSHYYEVAHELQVRSAAANLLQEQSVSDLSSVAQDVSAMFLLRDSSTKGMMEEAKNGSVLAIHNLAQSGQASSLLKDLSKVDAATQIKIVNAVAS